MAELNEQAVDYSGVIVFFFLFFWYYFTAFVLERLVFRLKILLIMQNDHSKFYRFAPSLELAVLGPASLFWRQNRLGSAVHSP